jgi:hypothetical protein
MIHNRVWCVCNSCMGLSMCTWDWRKFQAVVRRLPRPSDSKTLQHVDLLLCNGPYTCNRNTSCLQWCHTVVKEMLQTVFYVGPTLWLCDLTGWLQWSELVGEQSVRGLLQFSRCELLLLEAGSWSTEIAQKLRVKGRYNIKKHSHATARWDCNRLRTLICVWQQFVK